MTLNELALLLRRRIIISHSPTQSPTWTARIEEVAIQSGSTTADVKGMGALPKLALQDLANALAGKILQVGAGTKSFQITVPGDLVYREGV